MLTTLSTSSVHVPSSSLSVRPASSALGGSKGAACRVAHCTLLDTTSKVACHTPAPHSRHEAIPLGLCATLLPRHFYLEACPPTPSAAPRFSPDPVTVCPNKQQQMADTAPRVCAALDTPEGSLPLQVAAGIRGNAQFAARASLQACMDARDRKSTRLNSSHSQQSRMPSSA